MMVPNSCECRTYLRSLHNWDSNLCTLHSKSSTLSNWLSRGDLF